MRRTGKHKIEDLNKYIAILERRRVDIVARLDEIAERVLDKEKLASCKLIYEKIAALNEVN